MRTFLLTLLCALVCAIQVQATAIGYSYIPPTIDPPTLATAPSVTGGTPLSSPTLDLYTGTFGTGIVIGGPMDVQASPVGGNLTLQFTMLSTFTPQTTSDYRIYSFLYDQIWSNLSGTSAQVQSLTSTAYIATGTCTPPGCSILAQNNTTAFGTPSAIPYDPATDISGVSSFLGLFGGSWTSTPVLLNAYEGYTLVHDTTLQLTGLAPNEVIRIDLPEHSELVPTPEPATWGVVATAALCFALRRRRAA